MKDFVSTRLLDREQIIAVVVEALRMIPYYLGQQGLTPLNDPSSLIDKPKMVTIFHEKSTRTKNSFVEAAELVGCRVGGEINAETSSLGKGESLMNTYRTVIQQGARLVVLRSKIEGAGLHLVQGLRRTASASTFIPQNVSLLVGGAGTRDHPSQVLLDVVTIVCRELGIHSSDDVRKIRDIFDKLSEKGLAEKIGEILDNLKIAFVGDLLHSRVVHDWIHLGRKFNIHFLFIAPKVCQIEEWCLQGIKFSQSSKLLEARNSPYVYTIRMQKERLEKALSEPEADRITKGLQIRPRFMEGFSGVILDAQPIDADSPMIHFSLYTHPQVIMWQQSAMGIPTRMALIRICYQSRDEVVDLLAVPSVRPRVVLKETIEKHRVKMEKKWKERGGQRYVNPIDSGMVLDRITSGMIQKVDLLLERAGQFKIDRGPIIPARGCDSVAMGKKDIMWLDSRFIPSSILAALKVISPEMFVIKLKDGIYQSLDFPVASAVSGLFVCPNSNCITNHDPEAETFFHVFQHGQDLRSECAYCEHSFGREQIISNLR